MQIDIGTTDWECSLLPADIPPRKPWALRAYAHGSWKVAPPWFQICGLVSNQLSSMAGMRFQVTILCLCILDLLVLSNTLPKINFPRIIPNEGDTCKTDNIVNGTCTKEEQCDTAFLNHFANEDHKSACRANAFYKVYCYKPFLESCQRQPNPHIFGGVKAQSSKFPYLTRLGLINREHKTEWVCGATIISERFLLTAAHCKQQQSVPVTRVGLGCSETTVECEKILAMKNFIPHPQYNKSTKHHDIALIELHEIIEFNTRVLPVCPFPEMVDIPSIENLTIVGWGNTLRNVEVPRLMQATVRTVKLEDCKKIYEDVGKTTGIMVGNVIIDEMYCAHGSETADGYTDACQGDSGGPLVTVEDNNIYVVGVVSTGIGCGGKHPGLYTRPGLVSNQLSIMADVRFQVTILCLCILDLLVLSNTLPKIKFPPTIPNEGDSCSTDNIVNGKCTKEEQCDRAFLHYFANRDRQVVCRDNAFYKVYCYKPFLESCQDRSHSHIFNGTEAQSSKFPYLTRLGLINTEHETEWFCSATIISERFLLTAAHCEKQQSVPLTHVGLGCSETTVKCEKILAMKNFIPHPQYNKNVKYHDIALIELHDAIEFNTRVRPVCPFPDMIDVPASENLTIAGWGATLRNVEVPRLMQATVRTVKLEDCKKIHEDISKKSGIVFRRGIIDEMYCARGLQAEEGYVDACEGDSGGPLVVDEDDNKYVVGVISTGYGCGGEHPGLYTRVSSYFDWIKQNAV
uniref:Peptidase S1 domain-containing protein n=1 Tax=Anopheles dirus TaxID=7168 RepID=A0A182NN87_9DIPT